MKALKYIAIAVSVVMLVYQIADAGWDWEKVRGNGDRATKEVELEKFSEVMLATTGLAIVESGSSNRVIIEGESNLLEYVEVEVRNRTLVIETADGYVLDPTESLRYKITTTQPIEELSTASSGDIIASNMSDDRVIISTLSSGDIEIDVVDAKFVEIEVNSSGDIKIGEINSEVLEVQVNSSGSVVVDGGSVEEQDIRINSSGDFRGIKLASKDAYVKVNSSGDVYINVSDYLRVRNNSSGDIRLAGNPKIDSNMNSSGRIQKTSI